jgi:hypothetical protein
MHVNPSLGSTKVPTGHSFSHPPSNKTYPGRHFVHCAEVIALATVKSGISHDVHAASGHVSHSFLAKFASRVVERLAISQTPVEETVTHWLSKKDRLSPQSMQSVDNGPVHVTHSGEHLQKHPSSATLITERTKLSRRTQCSSHYQETVLMDSLCRNCMLLDCPNPALTGSGTWCRRQYRSNSSCSLPRRLDTAHLRYQRSPSHRPSIE